jgi:hypothetical protein
MTYKPYSPEWHRYRYLKEAIDKYIDDYVDTDTIMNDILGVVCDRQEKAHAEYHRLEELEMKLDFRD